MKKITEQPDRWVILEINYENDTVYKVFATWYGGYLDGDRYKLNSGIIKVEHDDDNYHIIGDSGSCYKCHKKGYGVATSYGRNILNSIIENAKKINATIIVLPKDTIWNDLIV